MTHLTLGHYDAPDGLSVAAVVAGLAIALLAFSSFANAFGQQPNAAPLGDPAGPINFPYAPPSGDGGQGVGASAHVALAQGVSASLQRNSLGAVVQMSTRGVRVVEVDPAGPAARAGIRRGDFILSVDGQAVRHTSSLTQMIARVPPGGRAFLVVWRFGAEVGIVVDFSVPTMQTVSWTTQPAPRAWLGADLVDSDRGVIVVRTSPDGPADEAGIRSGDVLLSIDDTRVAAVSDVVALIEAAVPENPLRMRVLRDGKELTCRVILRERALTQGVRRSIVQ